MGRILNASIAVLVGLALFSGVAAEGPPAIGGKPFTESGRDAEMPENWEQKPLQYELWAASADIAVTLDQHLYPALLPMIQRFARECRIRIEVHEGTCGISAGLLSRKQVDIGGFCCPPGKTDRLPGLRYHTLGISGLGLLVHPDNPIENISLGEAREIFQGRRHRWSELSRADGQPGPDMAIRPIGRLHCKQRPGHWRLLLDNEDLFSPRLEEVGTIRDMIGRVAAQPGGIGFEALWNIDRYRDEGPVRFLLIGGASPKSPDDLLALRYPLYRTYNITTWDTDITRDPFAEELARFLVREAGRVDPKYGIIPADRLRKAGWRFQGSELIGEPE